MQEPVHLRTEVKPADPGMLTRPRRKRNPRIDVAKTGPAREPDRRVIIFLNFHVLDLSVQWIVRVGELGAEGGVPAGIERVRRAQQVTARAQILGSEERRSWQPEIGAHGLTVIDTALACVTERVQRAQIGFAPHPALEAHDGKIFSRDAAFLTCLDLKNADVERASLAGQLAAEIDP